MNKVMLIGRVCKDADVRTSTTGTMVGRYNLAVERRFARDGEQKADFINCVTFGKGAEFAEKFLKKGIKIAVTGHIQTGSYEGSDGKKIYTTDVIVEDHEFCESKASQVATPKTDEDGFMRVDNAIDEELPFC